MAVPPDRPRHVLAGGTARQRGRRRPGGIRRETWLRTSWPPVTAIIPARNEEESIGATVTSLLRQDYPGAFTVIVVDDQSDDATARVAREAAAAIGAADRLTVLPGRALPTGWTGKLWAQNQGVELR